MQKTIQVRRANNSTAALGQHITLTNVRNSDEAMYGFGMTDDGEEVYIPAVMVRYCQMTEADVGAGFTCPVKPNPRAVDTPDGPAWVAINPLKWDDENPETVTIDVEEVTRSQDGPTESEWDALVVACSEITEELGPMNELVEFSAKLVQGAQHLQTKVSAQRDYIKRLQKKLDLLAPEVNE